MTSEIEGSVLTQQGIRLIGKLLRAKGALKLTRACAGDGIIEQDVDPETFTDLINYTSDMSILGFADSGDGEATIMLQASSIGVVHGYFIREAAVYAEDPDEGEILYAYAALQVNPLWIRPEGHAVTNLTDLNITIIVDRVENVTVSLSTNGLVTTGILNQRLAPLEPDTELITLDHGLNCYPQVMVATCPHSAGISGAGKGPAGGADIESFPAKPIYHGHNSLTIKTVKPVVELGRQPTLHRLSATEYAVTFADNPTTSVYIQLLCSLSAGTPSLPTDAVAFKNMVFSTTPPSDTSVLWGEPN